MDYIISKLDVFLTLMIISGMNIIASQFILVHVYSYALTYLSFCHAIFALDFMEEVVFQ